MTAKNPHGQFEWKRRRRIINVTLAFCMVAAGFILGAAIDGKDSTLLNSLTYSIFGLAGSVIGSYVFGAVWDDHSARKHGGSNSDDTGAAE